MRPRFQVLSCASGPLKPWPLLFALSARPCLAARVSVPFPLQRCARRSSGTARLATSGRWRPCNQVLRQPIHKGASRRRAAPRSQQGKAYCNLPCRCVCIHRHASSLPWPAAGAGMLVILRSSSNPGHAVPLCRVRLALNQTRRLTCRSTGGATAGHLAREALLAYPAPRGQGALPRRPGYLYVRPHRVQVEADRCSVCSKHTRKEWRTDCRWPILREELVLSAWRKK